MRVRVRVRVEGEGEDVGEVDEMRERVHLALHVVHVRRDGGRLLGAHPFRRAHELEQVILG